MPAIALMQSLVFDPSWDLTDDPIQDRSFSFVTFIIYQVYDRKITKSSGPFQSMHPCWLMRRSRSVILSSLWEATEAGAEPGRFSSLRFRRVETSPGVEIFSSVSRSVIEGDMDPSRWLSDWCDCTFRSSLVETCKRYLSTSPVDASCLGCYPLSTDNKTRGR